jgi:hypothetical protein
MVLYLFTTAIILIYVADSRKYYELFCKKVQKIDIFT